MSECVVAKVKGQKDRRVLMLMLLLLLSFALERLRNRLLSVKEGERRVLLLLPLSFSLKRDGNHLFSGVMMVHGF